MTVETLLKPVTSAPLIPRSAFYGAVLALCVIAIVSYLRFDEFSCILYVVVVGGLQSVLIVTGGIILAAARMFYPKLLFGKSVILLALFNCWLLFFGIAGDFAWMKIAWGRLYSNHDLFVEWIPFIPVGNWTVDPVCQGALTMGTTWKQMYLVWFSIAVPVWTFTILAYCWSRQFVYQLFLYRPFSVTITIVGVAAMTFGIFALFKL